VYVLEREVRGLYSLQSTDGGASDAVEGALGVDATPAANDEIPQQLTDALAAGEDGRETPEAIS